jgi:hypothetical protein
MMLSSQTLFQLLVFSLLPNSSRALDPRVHHHIDRRISTRAPAMSFERLTLREKFGATRSDTSKQQFLDLGLDGLGTYLGGALQGVDHVADVLGNEWSPTPDDDAAATAVKASSNVKYVVAQ